MSTVNVKLRGWHAIVVFGILVGVFVFRVFSLEKVTDEKLRSRVEQQLMSEYLPKSAAELKRLYEKGDEEALESFTKSLTSSKIDIESMKVSYKLLSFSNKKKNVVVKVKYRVTDSNGVVERGTRYFKFRHSGPPLETWQYRHTSSAVSYFLNFI
jgi:hypothetical protein